MSQLTPRERELVALGAALGSNCVPCIEYHIQESRKVGLADGQIREAIELADKIKAVPAKKVLLTATQILDGIAGTSSSLTEAAQCGDIAKRSSTCC